MRTTCLLALLSLWLLALAGAAPKKLEKKSIANSLAPKAIEPVEQKLDAPSPKISDEALMESPGETVDRAKKQASTTFCVEVRQNKPTYVDCNEASGGPGGSQIFVVPGNSGPDSSPNSGLPGPTSPLLPGGPHGLNGPHVLHLPHHHGPHAPHHGIHFSGPGSDGSPDNVPATIHYLFPGSDGSGMGPNGFGLNGGAPYNFPGANAGPNDGGLNGVLYQLPGGFPGDSSGAGPNGVHVHVHPNGGFPSGSGGPGGSSPTGVHFHLPGGSGGAPGGGSSGSPIHLSGIECLCAGTPAVGRDGEGSDGTPSNEALAVKFLQDLQKNDKPDGDGGKASSGDQSPSDQPSGAPTVVLPKMGMPFALPMMIGGMPMMRTGFSPYGWPYGLNGVDTPIMNGMPLMRTIGGPSNPNNAPSTGDAPSADGSAPTMRNYHLLPYGSPYASAYGLPMAGGNMPMMRAAGGMPMPMMIGGMPVMGGMMPMMRAAGGMPTMMGGMPMIGGLPIMRAADGTPILSGPGAGGAPQSPGQSSGKSGEESKNPTSPGVQVSIIGMPGRSGGDDPKNPQSPNGVPLAFMNMPMGKAGETPVPTSPNGAPMTVISMPMGRAGETPVPTSPNGAPMTVISMPMGRAGETPVPTSPNGAPMTVISMPMGRAGDNPVPTGVPGAPNGVPLAIMNMPMGRAGENPMIPTLPNGLPLPIMTLAGMKANGQLPDGSNMPSDGKVDPTILLRYQPMRPMQYPMQYPMHQPMYPHGLHPVNPMYQMPGGYVGPYSPHGFGGHHPHRSQYDCLQDSFQSVPAIQGLRFSRGPDESELPAGGQKADAEGPAESPAGSEHAEPTRRDDKESRISHFVDEEHNDAANSV